MSEPIVILSGNCLDVLKTLPAETVQCCVTSPPYWGLRDYGIPPTVWGGDAACDHVWIEHRWYTEQSAGKCGGDAFSKPGQANADRLKEARWRKDDTCAKCGAWRGVFGLEPTPQLYVEHAVSIFEEVRRVLRPDGTLWLNLGDSYATGAGKVGEHPGGGEQGARWKGDEYGGHRGSRGGSSKQQHTGANVGPLIQPNRLPIPGLKPKDLVGIPWRVAFALQAAGWWLRSDIIWHKPNPMPESVTDRPTKAHEYIFLLTKGERYHYDADAIAEPKAASTTSDGRTNGNGARRDRDFPGSASNSGTNLGGPDGTRNKRTVWTVTTQPYSEAHFATFPPDLIRPCIRAGAPKGGTVLDPFAGSGTTGAVAIEEGRKAVLIEMNPDYLRLIKNRTENVTPALL